MNVLLSSAGRRVEFLSCLRGSLRELDVEGKVVATDASPLTSAGLRADALVVVPPVDDPTYLDVLMTVVEKHRIDLVIPTIDTELEVLAAAADALRAVGAWVLVSGPLTVKISGDKDSTFRFLLGKGFPTPQQWSAEEARELASSLPYPVIAKPRRGSSGKGVLTAAGPAALGVAIATDDHIVQSVAPGAEYTVDVWVDQDGTVRSAVPRRRIEVRAGEVSKGVTEGNSMVGDLARRVAGELPDAYGPLTIQIFADGVQAQVIEINARFGGGYPLSWRAGARTTLWAIQDALSRRYDPASFVWRDGLVMLRHDESVFVHMSDLPQ